ncbi:MAG: pantothenate kinase [Desulfobulbus propionicus]|nr:MAG: pantothenate kinase [Desulfobulbus propionicus]
MLFTVDVGNSHTVSGVLHNNTFLTNWRLQSAQDSTPDELAIRYMTLFKLANIDPGEITGVIISSVVPLLETSWLHFAASCFTRLDQPPVAVNTSLNLGGLKIVLNNPAEIGADRIVNSIAAWDIFHTAFIVVDFGTAITFDCVNSRQEYLGGTIHPGIGISLDALASRTAKLPRLDIDATPKNIIGRSTVQAIHSGMLYGFGGLVDRMVDTLSLELAKADEPVNVIGTGGMAGLIKPYTQSLVTVDPHLTLSGLQKIYTLNTND